MKSVLPLAIGAVSLAACTSTASDPGQSANSASAATTAPRYDAELRYTAYGIPHVKADDFGAAGYGVGYAFARDNLCDASEWYLTLRGERSRYLGADGIYPEIFLFFNDVPLTNFTSDAFYTYIYTDQAIVRLRDAASADIRDMVAGYTAGFNRYLNDTPAAARPAACGSAAWLAPISEDDVWRRALHFTLVDTVNAFSVAAATAAPPADADAEAAMAPQTHTPQDVASLAEALRSEAASGSNAIAFGKAATGNGRGLLLGNPHFPWVGHERQYAAHVTVGDDYDMFGSLIYGLPVPLIGFNQDVAWSATYSTDNRVIIYDVTLDPNDPTRYLVDGESRAMRSVPVSVDVLQDDGTIEAREHIFWETEYGPVVTGGPLSWTKERAYTIFDANRGNLRNLDQWLDMGKSASVRELKDSMASIMGLQFSNIVAADRQGEALFANLSVAAKLPDRRLEDCITKPLGAGLLQLYSAIVADGSRSECQPLTTADAPAPGTVPASQRPFLFRDDYVIHSNDSHWAVNADPASFLTGFDRTLGEEKTPRGERFREGARLIEARLETDRFTAGDVHSMFYGATNMTGREIKAALLSHCAANETSDDVTAACAALRNWDGTAQPASRGAHLVREIMDRLPRVFRTPYILQDALWSTPFDPADPVSTPRDLIVDEPVLTAVTAAVTSMRERGIPLDGPLGDVQFFDVDGERLPAGGNPYALHLVRTTWDDTLGGYSHPVLIGDSFTHLVTFTDEGLDARFVLSYSQSTDPDSPHNDDQLPLYLSGDWIDLPFTDAEIEADPAFNSVRLQGD